MDKTALFSLSYGLYIVGVKKAGGFGGRVLDALAQVTDEESPLLAASFMKTGDALAALRESKAFTVSVLPKDVHPFLLANFGYQSGANADKWAHVAHTEWEGLPILNDAISYLYCQVEEIKEYGTHSLCLSRVVNTALGRKAPPLLYADYFQGLKDAAQSAFRDFQASGTLPKGNLSAESAPVQVPAEEASAAGQWICPLCGYVYDGELPFEELPEDWVCPLCGAPKSAFEQAS